MTPDGEFRELERKALEGGVEDMVAFVKAAMRVVDVALGSAKALEDAKSKAEATIEALKEEQRALVAKIGALHERADSLETRHDDAETPRFAHARQRFEEYDLLPYAPSKDRLPVSDEYLEDEGRSVKRFAYRRPDAPLEVEPWGGVDGDGWPNANGSSAKPPRSQYCPDNELQWRALVLDQIADLSRAIRKIAKVLHDTRVIEAPWTELDSYY